MGRGLKDCTEEDIIIFSDLDEIPNPEKIKEILQNFDRTKIYHFAQRLFYCYLNMEEVSGNLLSYAGEFPEAERSKDGIPRQRQKMAIGSEKCCRLSSLLKEQKLQAGRAAISGKKAVASAWRTAAGNFGYMGGHGEKDVKKTCGGKGPQRGASGI